MSGAWTFGGQDKDMMQRIVLLTNKYLQKNYVEAVGGPTATTRSSRAGCGGGSSRSERT